MKVTALLPDSLVEEVRLCAQKKNLTESLLLALSEWLALQKVKSLNKKMRQSPLHFVEHYSAKTVRERNRKR